MKRAQQLLLFFLTLAAAVCTAPATLYAAELAAFTAGKISVRLQSSDAAKDNSFAYQLIFKPVGGIQSLDFDLTAKVFALTGPTRLVIDLPNVGAAGDQKTALRDPLLATLRVGAHKDKTRFVLDVRSEAVATYNARPDAASESLIVDFALTPSASPAVETPLAMITPTPPPAPTRSPARVSDTTSTPSDTGPSDTGPSVTGPEDPDPAEAQDPRRQMKILRGNRTDGFKYLDGNFKPTFVFRNNERVESIPPVVRPADGAAAQVAPGSGAAVVKGIYFQAPSDSKVGAVALDIENLTTYRLDQASDETYELVIDKATLAGPHLVLPQFPPDTFGGFQVLIAREDKGNIAIRIHVNKGTKLTPYRAQEKLWIKAVDGQ